MKKKKKENHAVWGEMDRKVYHSFTVKVTWVRKNILDVFCILKNSKEHENESRKIKDLYVIS